jgi:hypothetical protein
VGFLFFEGFGLLLLVLWLEQRGMFCWYGCELWIVVVCSRTLYVGCLGRRSVYGRK